MASKFPKTVDGFILKMLKIIPPSSSRIVRVVVSEIIILEARKCNEILKNYEMKRVLGKIKGTRENSKIFLNIQL